MPAGEEPPSKSPSVGLPPTWVTRPKPAGTLSVSKGAARSRRPVPEVEKWLSPYLAYQA